MKNSKFQKNLKKNFFAQNFLEDSMSPKAYEKWSDMLGVPLKWSKMIFMVVLEQNCEFWGEQFRFLKFQNF